MDIFFEQYKKIFVCNFPQTPPDTAPGRNWNNTRANLLICHIRLVKTDGIQSFLQRAEFISRINLFFRIKCSSFASGTIRRVSETFCASCPVGQV